jgi:hypothetical protein
LIRVAAVATAAVESVQPVSTAIASATAPATTSTQVVALHPLVLHIPTEEAALIRAATEEATVGIGTVLALSTKPGLSVRAEPARLATGTRVGTESTRARRAKP